MEITAAVKKIATPKLKHIRRLCVAWSMYGTAGGANSLGQSRAVSGNLGQSRAVSGSLGQSRAISGKQRTAYCTGMARRVRLSKMSCIGAQTMSPRIETYGICARGGGV